MGMDLLWWIMFFSWLTYGAVMTGGWYWEYRNHTLSVSELSHDMEELIARNRSLAASVHQSYQLCRDYKGFIVRKLLWSEYLSYIAEKDDPLPPWSLDDEEEFKLDPKIVDAINAALEAAKKRVEEAGLKAAERIYKKTGVVDAEFQVIALPPPSEGEKAVPA